MRIAALILAFFLFGCKSHLFQFDAEIVGSKEVIKVKVIRQLTETEKIQGAKAVRYLESVMGEKFEADFSSVYVVKAMADFEGLASNYRKQGWKIFIGEDNLIRKERWEDYLRFAWTYQHEHYHSQGLNEQQVREKLDNKIIEKFKKDLTYTEFRSKFDALTNF